ncbi:MAG TPA: carbonic anhydrase [Solirubrobacteraceae bacterium]|jgi:carbonic anhydrase
MNEGSSLSRRGFIGGAAVGTAALAVGCGSSSKASSSSTTTTTATTGAAAPHPQTPDEALQVLQEGNQRYINGQLELRDFSPVAEQSASKQAPFAAIITCADSRISPSLVFDTIGGNLFVSRIAGNSVDTGTLGSTEYAVAVLGVKLLMVLGHSNCGAVDAALGVASGKKSYPPAKYGAIGPVVDLIVPTVKALPPDKRNLPDAIVANAHDQAKILASKEPIIAPAVKSGQIKVLAGVYDIASGQVSLV